MTEALFQKNVSQSETGTLVYVNLTFLTMTTFNWKKRSVTVKICRRPSSTRIFVSFQYTQAEEFRVMQSCILSPFDLAPQECN